MNQNYRRGRAAEYRAKKELETQGYDCIRAAGSHGRYDLVAFRDDCRDRCIQVKTVRSDAARIALLRYFLPIAHPHHSDEMWVWQEKQWHTKGSED